MTRRMLTVAKYEIIAALRGPAFWVVTALWLALRWFWLVDNAEQFALATLRTAATELNTVILLLILFTSVTMFRERREGSEDIFDSMPATNREQFWGKAKALGLMLLLAAALVLVVVTGVTIIRHGIHLYYLEALGPVVVDLLATVVFALVVGVVPSVLLRSEWVALITSLLVGLSLVMMEPLAHAVGIPALKLLSPFTVDSFAYTYSNLLGMWPLAGMVAQNWLFTGLAVGGCLLMALYWFKPARLGAGRMNKALVSGLVLLVAAGGVFWAYSATWADWRASADAEVAVYRNATAVEISQAAVPDFVITDYDLSVGQREDGAIDVTAVVEVLNTSQEPLHNLPFTLNHNLTAQGLRVTEVGGEELEIRIEGDALEVMRTQSLQPGDTVELSFEYGADLDQWRFSFSAAGLHKTVFTDREGVVLPAGYGWYPIAGWRRLVSPIIFGQVDSEKVLMMSSGEAFMGPKFSAALSVDCLNNLVAVSSLKQVSDSAFSASGVEGITLLALPFERYSGGAVNLLGPRGYGAYLSELETYTQALTDFYGDLVGVDLEPSFTVVVVPSWLRSALNTVESPWGEMHLYAEREYPILIKAVRRYNAWVQEQGADAGSFGAGADQGEVPPGARTIASAPVTSTQEKLHRQRLSRWFSGSIDMTTYSTYQASPDDILGGIVDYLYTHWVAEQQRHMPGQQGKAAFLNEILEERRDYQESQKSLPEGALQHLRPRRVRGINIAPNTNPVALMLEELYQARGDEGVRGVLSFLYQRALEGDLSPQDLVEAFETVGFANQGNQGK